MTYSLTVTVQPATEPLSLAEAKQHLRVDITDDDALIQSFIVAARMRVESSAFVRLITQTIQLTLDRFPWGWSASGFYSGRSRWFGVNDPWPVIELEPPVQSITSVVYVDPSGNPQTLSSSLYRTDINSSPARLTPSLNNVWPATAMVTAAVTVTYVAGFGAASAVPARLIEAVRLLTGHYYLNREQVLSGTRLVALEIPEGFDDLVRDFSPPLVA
jgi:hypothetical protein